MKIMKVKYIFPFFFYLKKLVKWWRGGRKLNDLSFFKNNSKYSVFFIFSSLPTNIKIMKQTTNFQKTCIFGFFNLFQFHFFLILFRWFFMLFLKGNNSHYSDLCIYTLKCKFIYWQILFSFVYFSLSLASLHLLLCFNHKSWNFVLVVLSIVKLSDLISNLWNTSNYREWSYLGMNSRMKWIYNIIILIYKWPHYKII